MAKSWYVLHTFTGHEKKVEKFIRIMMNDGSLGDAIVDVQIPSEEINEVRNGKRRVSRRNFLPGYILLEMELPEREWKRVCSSITRIQSVTGFVGTSRNSRPQPISASEAKVILQKTGAIKSDRRTQAMQSFSQGQEVRIIEGPFESFRGTVEVVNNEKSRLRVMVGIFGRSTPVELSFSQVEKT